MLNDRAILFYPLVVAAFPVIFLYAENTDKSITFAQFIVPFVAIMLLTALLVSLVRLFIKDSVKVGLIVSMCLVAFFSYGQMYDLTAPIKITIAGELVARHRYLLSALAVIVLVGIWVVLIYRGNLALLVRSVTVAALLLILFNVARIVAATVDSPAQSPVGANLLTTASNFPGGHQRTSGHLLLDFRRLQ